MLRHNCPKLMNTALAALIVLAATPAPASGISSQYTKLTDESCTVYAAAEEGDGDWVRMVCDGYRGYPVMIDYGDLRESLFYGFPPTGDQAPRWESFGHFNSTSGTIEWRIGTIGNGQSVPFATIHRWIISPGDGEGNTEVLVIEKVGQPESRQGCVVGYVVATGNGDANVQARQIADQRAKDFACGQDRPEILTGSVDLPPVSVADP